jgi:hypothetical protein
MKPSMKGIILAALQLALVASLGAKYALDRARRPRVWAQTVAYDPNLPIRGRYLGVQVRVDADEVFGNAPLANGNRGNFWGERKDVYLRAENGHLVASPAPQPTGLHVSRWKTPTGEEVAAISEPVAFFLPEHADIPMRRQLGEELWVEVTVPKHGPPRPIRLAVKRGGTFTPLEIK